MEKRRHLLGLGGLEQLDVPDQEGRICATSVDGRALVERGWFCSSASLMGFGRLVTPQDGPDSGVSKRGGGLVYVCAWAGLCSGDPMVHFLFFINNYTDWISRHHFCLFHSSLTAA